VAIDVHEAQALGRGCWLRSHCVARVRHRCAARRWRSVRPCAPVVSAAEPAGGAPAAAPEPSPPAPLDGGPINPDRPGGAPLNGGAIFDRRGNYEVPRAGSPSGRAGSGRPRPSPTDAFLPRPATRPPAYRPRMPVPAEGGTIINPNRPGGAPRPINPSRVGGPPEAP
jgi:hypothetical protein